MSPSAPSPTHSVPRPTCSYIPVCPLVLGAPELLVDQAGPKRHKGAHGVPTGEKGQKEEKAKSRPGRTRRQAAGTHRFTRPADTFRALLSFGAWLPRQSSYVSQRPLQARAGGAAITLVRKGHSQEPLSQAGSHARRHHKGCPCASLRAPHLCCLTPSLRNQSEEPPPTRLLAFFGAHGLPLQSFP